MQIKEVEKRNSEEIFVTYYSDRIISFIERFKKIDLVHFIGILFIMSSFNSYFGLPFFDSQPFPLLLAVMFILMRIIVTRGDLRTPELFVIIGVLVSFGIFLGAFFEFQFDMLFIRGVINYGSIFILMVAFYEYIKIYGFPIKIMIFVNILWILVALVQLIEPEILKYFVASRTSPGRGVTSMGPEPSSFGFYLFFTNWIYLLVVDYKPDRKLLALILINVLSIFFLAISAMTILFLFFTFLYFIIFNINRIFTIRNFSILMAVLGITLYVTFVILEGSRMEVLFSNLLTQNIYDLLQDDGSVNSRLAHQVLPLYLFFTNLGLPAGLQTFVEMVGDIDPSIIEILWGDLQDDKIMSWNATLIFEQGLFGILIWILLFTFLMDGTMWRFGEMALLFTLLFSSIPQSYPLIPLIFVIMYMTNSRYKSYKHKYMKARKRNLNYNNSSI